MGSNQQLPEISITTQDRFLLCVIRIGRSGNKSSNLHQKDRSFADLNLPNVFNIPSKDGI